MNMAKTDAEIVREVLERMGGQSNEAKAREITRVLGKRIRQRSRDRDGTKLSIPRGRRRRSTVRPAEAPRYSPVRIDGEPLSSTILRDRGSR